MADKRLLLLLLLVPLFVRAALIDLNTASSESLQTLNGVGPTYAQRIIDYRAATPFKTIDEVKNVSGIGDATFAKIKDFISVGAAIATTSAAASIAAEPSAHYNSDPITEVELVHDYKVGAGRDRIGTTGTPLQFVGTPSIENRGRTTYRWSFGDGSVLYGDTVVHAYLYPGDYAVVLQASSPSGHAVSRINVEIAPDLLRVSAAGHDRVELTNAGKTEVNLYGRSLVSGGKRFAFPEDTIIKAGQKISFAASVTGLAPADMSDTALLVGNARAPEKIAAVSATNNTDDKETATIYEKILSLERQEIELKKSEAASVELTAAAVSTGSTTHITAQNLEERSWLTSVRRFFGF